MAVYIAVMSVERIAINVQNQFGADINTPLGGVERVLL